MNPDNPIVRRCAEGMRAEQEGRHAEARVVRDAIARMRRPAAPVEKTRSA